MAFEDLKTIDTLDDKREIRVLLEKLTPDQRCEFLLWCVGQTNQHIKLRSNPPWVLVKADNATGEAMETFWDLCLLISTHGLPIQTVLTELERRSAAAVTLWTP